MLLTSRLKARDGYRCPCPYEPFIHGEQSSGLKGMQCPVEHRRNLYIHLCIYMYTSEEFIHTLKHDVAIEIV